DWPSGSHLLAIFGVVRCGRCPFPLTRADPLTGNDPSGEAAEKRQHVPIIPFFVFGILVAMTLRSTSMVPAGCCQP
ncbi:MAG: hypothetical protein ABIP03_06525, partial [Aquihabitans sp.]